MTVIEPGLDLEPLRRSEGDGDRFWGQVVERPVAVLSGTALTVAAGASAATLTVKDAADFNADGGQLRLRLSQTGSVDAEAPVDVVVDYTGWDGDYDDVPDDTISLAAPLPAPLTGAPVGCYVDVWDPARAAPAQEWVVQVVPDDSDTGVSLDVTVDPDQVAGLPAGSLPGPGETVLVEAVDGDEDDLRLVRVVGTAPYLSLDHLDTDTVPPLPPPEGVVFEPTVPPAASPAVEVSGVTDGLILTLVDQLEAGAVVTFHLSGDQTAAGGFVPSAATAVGPATASAIASPTTLPDGTPLTEGTTYWARAVASNIVGAAPAGPAASGSPDRSRPRSLITDTLKALRAVLDRLDIGQAYIDADEGFMIPNPPPPNGGDRTWSRIPFDGVSPMVMLIDLIATRLSVQGVAEFLDRVTFRRRAMAADGVSAPSLAPTVAPHWPAVATTAGTAGLALDPSNAARWVTAYLVPFTTQTPQRVGVRSILKTTGAQATFHTGATTQATAVAGLTVIGQRIYVLSQLTGFTSQWKVSVFDTAGAQVDSWNVATSYPHQPAIGNDGAGRVLIGFVDAQDRLRIRPYSTAGVQDALIDLGDTTLTDLAWVGYSTYNYGGSNRLIVAPTDANALVWSGTLTNLTRQPSQDFPRALGGLLGGLAWDGVRLHALTGARIAQHTASEARTVAQSVQAAYDWSGLSSSLVVIETNVGPTVTANIPAQAQMLVTTDTPPEADLADPGVANRAAVYLAATGGTLRRQGNPLPVGTRALAVDAIGTTGRTAGATGTFTSAAADIVPENPGKDAPDSQRGWRLSGGGGGWIGGSATGINWSPSGIITFGSEAAAKIRALVAGASLGASTLRDDVVAAARDDSGFLNLPLASGFSNPTNPARTSTYRRQNGGVSIDLAVAGSIGTTNTTVATIPTGYRPGKDIGPIPASAGAPGGGVVHAFVLTTGVVQLRGAAAVTQGYMQITYPL